MATRWRWLALAGALKAGAWIDRNGNARPSLDLVAAQVLAVYGLAKKRKAATDAGNTKQPPGQPGADGGAAVGDPGAAWLRGEG